MKRRLAREIAIQSLYQMEMNDVGADAAIETVLEEIEQDNESNQTVEDKPALVHYVEKLVNGTYSIRAQIDQLLIVYLKGWKMDRLSRVDRQILRLAVYEMVYLDDVPPKVVINEAIELAKHFGVEESGKFVNGVLGKMIKELDRIKAQFQLNLNQ